ncbi:MAG: hypothetical protein M5R36_09645 [Deltaproteobacteria bacterium]|nr:hypothetical protein [Deltaproteobacteria bacterium]
MKDETKGRCDFPILLRRRDREVVEWAAIGIDLERADDGRWRFVYYQQDSLDKEAYDKRKAEEERKREAAAEAHRKLAEAKAAAEADDAAP